MTFSSFTPSSNVSSSILPSSRAVRIRCSIFLASLYFFFFVWDGFVFGGEEGSIEDEAVVMLTWVDGNVVEGASASSKVFSSARSRLCVARMEHFRQMQSLRISKRV